MGKLLNKKVTILTGANRNESGEVIYESKDGMYVKVQGLMLSTKHNKPNAYTGAAGGIKKVERKIHVSNVRLVK
jgi:large subunit ribosomal protein L24